MLDEPLFGHFLKHTGVQRPSREEALAAMETDPLVVIEEQLLGKLDRPILFMKHMANHLEGLDLSFLKTFKNVILTRHPAGVIASYIKNIDTPTLLDLCYSHQVQVLHYLNSHELPVTVLDSAEILENPRNALTKLCHWCDIPFDDAMLSWKVGPRPEDGVWAKYWYHRVHQSTGFAPYMKTDQSVPERLQPLLKECIPLYEELLSHQLNLS